MKQVKLTLSARVFKELINLGSNRIKPYIQFVHSRGDIYISATDGGIALITSMSPITLLDEIWDIPHLHTWVLDLTDIAHELVKYVNDSTRAALMTIVLKNESMQIIGNSTLWPLTTQPHEKIPLFERGLVPTRVSGVPSRYSPYNLYRVFGKSKRIAGHFCEIQPNGDGPGVVVLNDNTIMLVGADKDRANKYDSYNEPGHPIARRFVSGIPSVAYPPPEALHVYTDALRSLIRTPFSKSELSIAGHRKLSVEKFVALVDHGDVGLAELENAHTALSVDTNSELRDIVATLSAMLNEDNDARLKAIEVLKSKILQFKFLQTGEEGEEGEEGDENA